MDFVSKLQRLSRKHRMTQQRLLAMFLRAPMPTDIPVTEILNARNKLAEEGREYTPAEVLETVELAFCKVRNFMRDEGYDVPDSDLALRSLLRSKT